MVSGLAEARMGKSRSGEEAERLRSQNDQSVVERFCASTTARRQQDSLEELIQSKSEWTARRS